MKAAIALAAVLAGLAGHQARRFTRELAYGWANLVENMISVALLLPFLILFDQALLTQFEQPARGPGGQLPALSGQDPPAAAGRLGLAYVLAAVFVGIGNGLGWFISSLRVESNE